MSSWSPASWQNFPAQQQPAYASKDHLDQVATQLRNLPPLVSVWEIEALKQQIALAQEGERFLLHGGDCAESFDDCTESVIVNKLKILLQMSLVLVHGLDRRIIRLGRIAGQYAKPRSSDVEERDGVVLPTYRGDLINGAEFDPQKRAPDPNRLLRGYERSGLTLNYIRALVEGGFADLHHPENWELEFMQQAPVAAPYRKIVDDISGSLNFLETVLGERANEASRVDFYTSHEGLSLVYEESLTKRPDGSDWYNLSTHFPWIGARTADIDGAHVEYFRGINNPIGIKVGPGTTPDKLEQLIERLNPENEPGRITLIHRFGASNVGDCLSALIQCVQQSGYRVLWVCDPMHGNTITTDSGIKTRSFDQILAELKQAFEIHAAEGSYLGGVHFELTGEDVTECVGGAAGLSELDLGRAYRTQVDPRLNYQQALEMAMLVVDIARQGNDHKSR